MRKHLKLTVKFSCSELRKTNTQSCILAGWRIVLLCCLFMFLYVYVNIFPSANRPPERRHGYEQQFVTSVTPQPEHESLEPKRQRVEGPSETHYTRAPTGTIVLPLPHVMQDGIRAAAGEVKKVRHNCHSLPAVSVRLFLFFADKVQYLGFRSWSTWMNFKGTLGNVFTLICQLRSQLDD